MKTEEFKEIEAKLQTAIDEEMRLETELSDEKTEINNRSDVESELSEAKKELSLLTTRIRGLEDRLDHIKNLRGGQSRKSREYKAARDAVANYRKMLDLAK